MFRVVAKDLDNIPRVFGIASTLSEAVNECLFAKDEYKRTDVRFTNRLEVDIDTPDGWRFSRYYVIKSA